MIYVCDAIMGSGKSQSAITYMNEHPERKFIYVTPYLTEATRIRDGCPALKFVEPSNAYEKYNHSKIFHTLELVKAGRNVTTTHQAFRSYPPELLSEIRDAEYTIIIDEAVNILEEFEVSQADLDILEECGFIKKAENRYEKGEREYKGEAFDELIRMLDCRDLIVGYDEDGTKKQMFWILPPELFTCAKDIFVLTFLFDGQHMRQMFDMYGLEYERINVARDGDVYRFSKTEKYVPDYVKDIVGNIRIVDGGRINKVGDAENAFSKNWVKTHKDQVEQTKKNLHNLYSVRWKGRPVENRLWGTYNCGKEKFKGRGYTNNFLVYNQRASNDWRNCDMLAYLANVYMSVPMKVFYRENGLVVDEEMFALSVMIQWIWRSAIRDGKPIDLYLPSSRMRRILKNWMNSLMEEVNL